MSYRPSLKNTRLKSSTSKHTFRFALFVAFGFWLLYQIRQSYTTISVKGDSFSIHLNNERISNMLGRKGIVKVLRSTHRVDSTVILDDVTNPGDVGFGFREHKNRDDEKETAFVEGLELISTEVLTKIESSNHGLNDSEDGVPRFLDENGIPEIDRDKFVGNESTQSGN